MNQIALGDETAGYTVLDGASVTAPNFKATLFLSTSSLPNVDETLEIQLKGSPSQIEGFLSTLTRVINRQMDYEKAIYPVPQCLRFQKIPSGPYYYAPISNLSYSSNASGYLSQASGSRVLMLSYSRANHFDGPQIQLPLTGATGVVNPPGAVAIDNATQLNYANTALIDAKDFSTDLPAPIRLEFTFASQAEYLADFYVGIYHHATHKQDAPFFYYQNAFSGGNKITDAGAISGAYKTYTYTSATWGGLFLMTLDAAAIAVYSGFTFRPFLHLFGPHAYDDLYLRLQIQYGTTDLFFSEPVWAPPGYDYIILPPVALPPNFLLREVPAASLYFNIEYFRLTGLTTTLSVDCLTFFPVSYGASFFGFRPMTDGNRFTYDSFLNRFNTRLFPNEGELISHSLVGGPLFLHPGEHSRLFFYLVDHQNLMKPRLQGNLKVYYRPRIQCL